MEWKRGHFSKRIDPKREVKRRVEKLLPPDAARVGKSATKRGRIKATLKEECDNERHPVGMMMTFPPPFVYFFPSILSFSHFSSVPL